MVIAYLVIRLYRGEKIVKRLWNELRRHGDQARNPRDAGDAILRNERFVVYRGRKNLRVVLESPFHRPEKKPAILLDRAANRSAKILPVVGRFVKIPNTVKVFDARHGIVPAKRKCRAMPLIGSRFGDNFHHSGTGPAILRRET